MKNTTGLSIPVLIALFVVVVLIAVFLNGLIVLGAWHVFNLYAIVHITYWQAVGIAFILGLFNVSTAASRR